MPPRVELLVDDPPDARRCWEDRLAGGNTERADELVTVVELQGVRATRDHDHRSEVRDRPLRGHGPGQDLERRARPVAQELHERCAHRLRVHFDAGLRRCELRTVCGRTGDAGGARGAVVTACEERDEPVELRVRVLDRQRNVAVRCGGQRRAHSVVDADCGIELTRRHLHHLAAVGDRDGTREGSLDAEPGRLGAQPADAETSDRDALRDHPSGSGRGRGCAG